MVISIEHFKNVSLFVYRPRPNLLRYWVWYTFVYDLIFLWPLVCDIVTGADPGFQVRGGGGGGAHVKRLRRAEYFVWKITILRKKIIFFPILGGGGGGARRVRLPLDPPLSYSGVQFTTKHIYTVKPVYNGHSREHGNVVLMSSCPLYTG